MLPTQITVASILGTASTIIGILGGMLGAYTFLDNYILRFKPKFLIGDRIYLTYQQHEKIHDYSHLSAMICQFEIFNHRNKLGRIEDLLIRIYDSRELEATVLHLYPASFLDTMPNSRDDILDAKRVPPAPIAIPNKSSKTAVIEFAQEQLHTGTVKPSGYLKIEALYKSANGKWLKLGAFSLHAGFNEKSTYGVFSIYNFDRVERYSERERLKQKKMTKAVSSYKGLSHYYLSMWLPRPYWRIKEFIQSVPKIIKFLGSLVSATVRAFISETIEWWVVKRTAARSRKPRITIGNVKNARHTATLMAKLKQLISNKVAELNFKVPSSDAITVEMDDRTITLKKKATQIHVYIGGDGFVGVHRSPVNSPKGEMVFSIRLKEFPLGAYLWRLSDRPVLATTIATRIVDYISLLHE
jgi:hypothetical protein